MKIYVLTIFPSLFEPFINDGLIQKGTQAGAVEFEIINPRDFATDKHRTVDDVPYGGGRGMVMKPEPIIAAYESIPQEDRDIARVLVPTPRGVLLAQPKMTEYSADSVLIFICGRYKDIDQRVVEITDAEEISIGDYVIQGGEIPAMAIIEGVTRLLPEFIGDIDSAESDSFWDSRKLSAPSYTRPREYRGLEVPDILLSGHHANIVKWREEEGTKLTKLRRPDLMD